MTEVDTEQMPNFQALKEWVANHPDTEKLEPLRRWITRLKTWCEAAQEEIERARNENESLAGELDVANDLAARTSELDQAIADWARGLRDDAELKALIPR